MKMRIPDDQMIESLMGSGAHQRLAVAWWLLQNHDAVDETPGFPHAYPDKNALSVEILAQYMCQLEMLEMVYFALREKVRTPARSFTECYLGVHIKEHNTERPNTAMPTFCAARMLEQLDGMTVARFHQELGLPRIAELLTADCGAPMAAMDGSEAEFEEHITTLIQWMRQAIENKANRSLHEAYMKTKHGFAVLTSPHYPEIHFILGTEQGQTDQCVAEVFRFDNSPETLRGLVDDTKLIGEISRALLKLYLRRSPLHSCADCKSRGQDGGCDGSEAQRHS